MPRNVDVVTASDALVRKPTFEVALALVLHDGRWLVARRKPDAHLGGLWEFPGGKLATNETPAEAAIRELSEECAVEATLRHVLDPVTYEYADRTVRLTPVICTWTSGEPQPLCADVCRWVSTEELVRLDMPPVNVTIIRAALERLAADGRAR
jgi:mutator protein MutT